MKKPILASIFILCFSFSAFAQSEHIQCPTMTVQGQLGVTNLGGSMSFEVLISEKNQNIEYEWTVEPKIDFSGQGTSKIKLMTNIDLAGANITATVKIKGLPENCNNTASDIGPVDPGCRLTAEQMPPYMFDFTDLGDVKAVIDGLWLQIANNNKSGTGYILFEIENDKQLQEVKERISFINKHIEYRGYDPKNYILEVCKTGVYDTTARYIPEDIELPRPENCIMIDIKLK